MRKGADGRAFLEENGAGVDFQRIQFRVPITVAPVRYPKTALQVAKSIFLKLGSKSLPFASR